MMNDINPTAQIHPATLERLKNRSFIFIGANCKIGDCKIGNFCSINAGTIIEDGSNLQNYVHTTDNTYLGPNTFLGAYVVFADEKFPAVGKQVRRPCRLEGNNIIGTHSVLIASDMGRDAVLGSNSESFKDIPAYEVWKGQPARQVLIDDEYPLGVMRGMVRSDYDSKKASWEEKVQ